MKTHELARLLLEGPDELVIIPLGLNEEGDNTEAHDYVSRVYRTNAKYNEFGCLELDIHGSPATVLETY